MTRSATGNCGGNTDGCLARDETLANDVQLGAAVRQIGEQLGHIRRAPGQLVEQLRSDAEVYWPPVVRVDQAEVPQLGALVVVGDAGRGDFDERLRE